ncbi:MAG: hypothetical protein K8H88_20100 [Sandaracinaceae bacterium]|nr:hypothetical protein [Sandaracinaceae bacterium]
MAPFDFFIALDGNGLNGFEGFGGIARLRCEPERDRFDIDVRFFDGIAGAHATQINPQGTLGFLGNLSQNLVFYDPRTLEEVSRASTLRFAAPRVVYESSTHVAWLGERRFVTPIGKDFYLFSVDDLEHPEKLGPHGVTLPHALKRSPSGRYLFYGAMDHDAHGFANQAGIFDLEERTARVVELPATVWHLGVHPKRDVFYAPTQRCRPQHGSFMEYVIADLKNYLFEIDGPSATVLRHLAIPKDLPGALTSDVVVTEGEVLWNICAAGVIARTSLADFKRVEYVDEKPPRWRELLAFRAAAGNLVEAFARANVIGEPNLLVKAVRASRGQLLDGSYGLGLSPDRKWLLSAHRGLNEVIVYRYPDMKEHRRVPFPSLRKFFPEHLGPLADNRLGFHHATVCSQ